MDLSNGLLGLGGLGGFSPKPAQNGLLAQYMDPEAMQKAQLKRAMLQAGIGMLQGSEKGFGNGLAHGLAGGLQGYQGAEDDFLKNAQMQYGFDQQARQDARANTEYDWKLEDRALKEEQRKHMEEVIGTLPPELQGFAKADPEGFMKEYSKNKAFPPSPTYETVQTDEGVFRVPNNNPDPKAMVKIGNRPERNEGEGREFAQESKLRDVYIKQAKPFEDLRVNYQRIQAANQDNSGASDIAMVYSFMKMLDPTSVVREGEFATAQNAGGIPDQIKSMYNKAISGERLTPEVRTSFMQQAGRQFQEQYKSYQQVQGTFRTLAEQYGVDPNRVAPDLSYGVSPPAEIPPPAMGNDLKSKYGLE